MTEILLKGYTKCMSLWSGIGAGLISLTMGNPVGFRSICKTQFTACSCLSGYKVSSAVNQWHIPTSEVNVNIDKRIKVTTINIVNVSFTTFSYQMLPMFYIISFK